MRRQWLLVTAAIALGVGGVVFGLIHKQWYDESIDARAGAARSLEIRIASLAEEQRARRTELDAIQTSIRDARLALDLARHDAEAGRCEARNAQLDAAITVRRVECFQQVAAFHLCDARNKEARADDTLFGALLGTGLALATGGSSLLVTGGAMLGAASSESDECPRVACELRYEVIEAELLRERGRDQREACAAGSK